MSNSENNEDNDKTITYVYLPDEDMHGLLVKEGAYLSTVQYFDNGVGYIIEVPNEDFIIVNEINIGHINETEENL
jgi:hypothetical protein